MNRIWRFLDMNFGMGIWLFVDVFDVNGKARLVAFHVIEEASQLFR